MALREDYYTPCVEEINRRKNLIDEIIDDITPGNYDEEFGMENSKYSDNIEGEIRKVIDGFENMKEILETEKGKLANTASDVGGWF